jgi:hypothetical protein
MRTRHIVLLTFIVAVLAPRLGVCQVYEWIDAEGVQHFSTSKPDPEAKLAELPEITKERSLRAKASFDSCVDHGGVNCGDGPDVDGSVICYDGYRDSSPRYRFSCYETHLEVLEITQTSVEEPHKIIVRNALSVPAKGVMVSFTNPKGEEYLAKGPRELQALAMGEYAIDPSLKQTPEKARISVTCTNCK